MAERIEAAEHNSETKTHEQTSTAASEALAVPPSAAAAPAESAAEAKRASQPAEPVAPPVPREQEKRIVAARAPLKPPPARSAPVREKPKSRFPLLAATLAIAAGLGGAAGAVGIQALIHLSLRSAKAAPPPAETAQAEVTKAIVAQLTTDMSALRTAVEQSSKLTATQFGKVTERLERAERAQAEPAARLAKIGEAIERLERRAAPTIASPPADVTGSVNTAHPPASEPKPKPAIIDDYVVRKVFDGVALVEGRRGIIEVEPGSTLPGAGRVEEIRRQDGRWVVVTNKGVIVPAR